MPNQLSRLLQEWTGERWVIALSNEPGEPTIAEQKDAAHLRSLAEAARHPVVKAALEAFPGARIKAVRPRSPASEPGPEPFDAPEYDEPDEEP